MKTEDVGIDEWNTTDLYGQACEDCFQLQRYYELTSDEWSEAMSLMCSLVHSSAISEELTQMLAEEIHSNHEYALENGTIVEKEETITRKIAYVKWND